MGGNVSTCSVYTFRTSPYVSILKFDNTKEHYNLQLLGCMMGGNVSTCSVYTFRTSPYVSILKFDNTKEHYRVIRMYDGRKCINLQSIHISNKSIC